MPSRILLATLAVVILVGAAAAYRLAGDRRSTPGPAAVPPTAAPPATAPSDWPIFRGDAGLRGVVAASLPDKLALRWTFATEGPVKSSAVVAGGRVFVGSDDGKVYALDLTSGHKAWDYQTGDAVEAPPLFHEGTIYVGSHDGRLYALDAAGGEPRWAYATGGKIAGGANAVTVEGRTLLVVGSYDNLVHAIDAAGGERRWTYETGNYVNGTPAITGGTGGAAGSGARVVIGGCDGQLHVIAAGDGTGLGRVPLGAYIAAPPAADAGTAYVGHYGNAVVAVRLPTEAAAPTATAGENVEPEVAWRFHDRDFPYFSGPAVAGDRVLIGGRDRRLHCLRRDDGHELWSFRTGGKVDSSPVVAGDRAAVGSSDGRLYLVNLADGAEVWSYDVGEDIVASPAVAGGMIVIGSLDGKVYAFGRE